MVNHLSISGLPAGAYERNRKMNKYVLLIGCGCLFVFAAVGSEAGSDVFKILLSNALTLGWIAISVKDNNSKK